jgi:hypothetical protein
MGPGHLVEYGSLRLSCGRDILARMESALGCRGSFAMVNMDDDDCAKATVAHAVGASARIPHGLSVI